MRKLEFGAKVWAIPDCFLAVRSGGLPCRASASIFNLGERPAVVKLVAYFEDRDPLEGFSIVCPARRVVQVRLASLRNDRRQLLPTGVPFALKIESNRVVVVEHTRLAPPGPALALMTTIATSAA